MCSSHLHTEQYVVRAFAVLPVHHNHRCARCFMAYRSLTMTRQTVLYVSSTCSCGVHCTYLWYQRLPSTPTDHGFCANGDCSQTHLLRLVSMPLGTHISSINSREPLTCQCLPIVPYCRIDHPSDSAECAISSAPTTLDVRGVAYHHPTIDRVLFVNIDRSLFRY